MKADGSHAAQLKLQTAQGTPGTWAEPVCSGALAPTDTESTSVFQKLHPSTVFWILENGNSGHYKRK